jgi:hypothetical protein
MPKKSIKMVPKTPSRLAASPQPVSAIQLPDELTRAVDSWAADHGISRSKAITDLLEQALSIARPITKDSRTKATELAGKEIDKVINSSASAEDRQRRKRQLLKGPSEFRDIRGDRSKPKA